MMIPTQQDRPLMWTIRGNVPSNDLRYEKEWIREGEFIFFKEAWYFDDGTLAKNNTHGIHVQAIEQLNKAKNVTIESAEHLDGETSTAWPNTKANDVTVSLVGAGIGGQQASLQ